MTGRAGGSADPQRTLIGEAIEYRTHTDSLGTNPPALVSKLLPNCRVPLER